MRKWGSGELTMKAYKSSEALDPKKISRRSVVGGIAALCVHGFSRQVRAAEARPLAERLAAYAAALRYEDLDGPTIERIKSHVIDTLGCGIAAFDERPVRVCREIAQTVQGAATIIGTTRKTSPDLAAFANGAAGRYYDLNDIYAGVVTSHPSDHIAPSIAVAEAERASAHDLITAIALAYEIDCRAYLSVGSRDPRHACPVRLETGGRCARRFVESSAAALRSFARLL